ncbi:hypothetical protein D7I40_24495, partial [Citrobacter sp. MH181794]
VAFIVDNNLKNVILDFTPVNERICVLRIKGRFQNLSIVNAHAPTEDKEELVKDQFYQTLERIYDALPNYDIKMVLGDLNAKVGRETIYKEIVGTHSLHETSNDNGKRFIEFATSKNALISSTSFPRKDIYKATWRSPNGQTNNQIDHVAIEKKGATNIMDVRTYRGFYADSDHYMVMTKYRSRITRASRRLRSRIQKINIGKLDHGQTKENFQRYIEDKLTLDEGQQDPPQQLDIETSWQQIKSTLKEAANSILGHQNRRNGREWFDDECRQAIERRNDAYKAYLSRPTRVKHERFRELRRESDKICRKKKRAAVNNMLLQADEMMGVNNLRDAYRKFNTLRKGYQARCDLCRDKRGDIVANPREIKERWREYFSELLGTVSAHNQINTTDDQMGQTGEQYEHLTAPPTLEEVNSEIKKLKKNKAPGIDEISAELIKEGGSKLTCKIHSLINQIWDSEQIPEDWKTIVIFPIYKKGDKLDCRNYRGISLLCTTYKILTSI